MRRVWRKEGTSERVVLPNRYQPGVVSKLSFYVILTKFVIHKKLFFMGFCVRLNGGSYVLGQSRATENATLSALSTYR